MLRVLLRKRGRWLGFCLYRWQFWSASGTDSGADSGDWDLLCGSGSRTEQMKGVKSSLELSSPRADWFDASWLELARAHSHDAAFTCKALSLLDFRVNCWQCQHEFTLWASPRQMRQRVCSSVWGSLLPDGNIFKLWLEMWFWPLDDSFVFFFKSYGEKTNLDESPWRNRRRVPKWSWKKQQRQQLKTRDRRHPL